ncbi:MAG: FHA domain-containing protein [Anaerolineales bacterium]|nr:FHA domain-containing protein [Anaerolineales bacterium]
MADELVCPNHGPYDASYGACPYCQAEAGGRPSAPVPLDEDDLPTDLGAAPPRVGYDDEEPTELGAGRRGRRFLDLEEGEETEIRRLEDETVLEEPDTGPQAILWVKDGHRRGRIHKIKDGTVVGRKDGDLILDDPKVSNPHARFRVEDEQFMLWDFGSSNGTHVNGERIRAATPLKENDELKIGDTTFIVKTMLD